MSQHKSLSYFVEQSKIFLEFLYENCKKNFSCCKRSTFLVEKFIWVFRDVVVGSTNTFGNVVFLVLQVHKLEEQTNLITQIYLLTTQKHMVCP